MKIPFLRKKKKGDKKKPTAKISQKIEKKKEKLEKKEAPAKVPSIKTKISKEEINKILISPHISEKATELGEKNKYVFRVGTRANKTEIKKAIESLYKVNILSVNIIKVPKKERRLGRITGFKKGYKKAVVTIQKGQKIEVL